MSSKLNSPPHAGGGQTDTIYSASLLTPIKIVPQAAMQVNDVSDSRSPTSQKEDKLPHDASVFVGSLPSNIDQGDLTRMLMEHLSEHTQVKNIKVVRDAKGGVCAFVQCENADSATALIYTLHSRPPKPFLGRILRYEPARAFRTLLLSYRTPTQYMRSNGNNGPQSPGTAGSEVDLDLPDAMRVWKHRNSRFHSILYNFDAVQAEENHNHNASDACVSDTSILIQPLNFDEETLYKLASYFGRLEKFSPLETLKADAVRVQGLPSENLAPSVGDEKVDIQVTGAEQNVYPVPHNGPRAPNMDTTCWEVKWEHRDDCVSALMTLKRVPHLTVTWAHQPASSSGHSASPNYQQVPTSPSYYPHAQRRISLSQLSPGASTKKYTQPLHEVIQSQRSPIFNNDGNLFQNRTPDQRPSESTNNISETGYEWADHSEFSGLKNAARISEARRDDRKILPAKKSWADGGYSPTLSSTTDGEAEKINEDFGSIGERQHSHLTRNISIDFENPEEDNVQELYMPQTPALDNTSVTPITPGSQFPITPTISGVDIVQDLDSKGFDAKEKAAFNNSRPDREIDPTTLFVGGLEMFGPGAWDEEKVKNFFSRFGGLESVKVVRPLNSCAAFAFVKFDNAEAPARAVFEEHNRVYEGRAMRVQLRDCNPPRNNWKSGRGRGRPHQNHQNHFNAQRRYHRQSYEDQSFHRFQHENGKLNLKDRDDASEIQLASLSAALPSVNKAGDNNMRPDSADPCISSSDLTAAARTSPPAEKYREWYDEPESPAHTPEPSSLGSSVSTTGVQFPVPPYTYPLPHSPFFPPQPWMQPYMTQTPYQIPYYPGYPVFSPAAPHQPSQARTSPPNSDVGGPTMTAHPAWPHVGMYASYIPYPAVLPRPAVVDPGQAQFAAQAPLIPTGFIQNEQGTLIAVYQPEALDQYMAGSGVTPSTANRHPNSTMGNPRWGNTSPYHDGINIQSSSTTHSTPNQGRNQNNIIPPTVSQQFPDFQHSPAPLRGVDVSLNNTSPFYRRQGQRRDNVQQNGTSSVRNHNHPRPYNGRSSRGHHPDLGHSMSPATPGGEWNRWTGAR